MKAEEEQQIVDKAGDMAFKAPNGKPSNLSPKQWAQVRTKAFIEWFGDWMKTLRIEKLRNSKPVVISGEEYRDKYDLNPKSASRYILDNLRGEYTNRDTGEPINVSRKGAEKIVSHDKANEAHLQSIVAIPQLLENAIFITEEKNSKNSAPFEYYRYYVTGLKIGEENYTVKLAIGVLNGETYYDHSLTEIEKVDLINSIDSLSIEFANNKTDLSHLKDKRLLSILQTNSSKVVDENGEPLVVYHGSSSQNIDVFDKSKSTRKRSGLKEFGSFFTTNRELAEYYASIPMREDLVAEIDAQIAALEAEQAKTRNNRDYDRLEEQIGILEAQRDGRVYEVFLNLRDMYEVDAEGMTYAEGRQKISVPLSYKTAYGIDAIEALAGENSMDDSVSADGIKMSNVLEMSVGSTNPNVIAQYYKKYGGDSYQVFASNDIKSATENNGEFSSESDDIRLRAARSSNKFDAVQREAVEKKGIVSPDLASKSVEVVEAPPHGFSNFTEAKKWAKDNIAKTYSSEETGGKGSIRISNTTIDKYFARTAIDKSDNKDVHQRVVKVLPEVIRTSIEAEVHPDYKKVEGSRSSNNEVNDNVLVHRLYGSVDVDGETYRVKITLRDDSTSKGPQSAYSYEATKIELLKGTLGNSANSSLSPSDSNSISKVMYISATNLLNGVEKSYDKGKKLLDESENSSQSGQDDGNFTDEAAQNDGDFTDRIAQNDGDFSSQAVENQGEAAYPSTNIVEAAENVPTTEAATTVEQLSEMLNTPIKTINRAEITNDMPYAAAKRKAKGWYDTRTGEATVVADNHSSQDDVIATVLHEVVGHKGLRSLFGEGFDSMLADVYALLPDDVRQSIRVAAHNSTNIPTNIWIKNISDCRK